MGMGVIVRKLLLWVLIVLSVLGLVGGIVSVIWMPPKQRPDLELDKLLASYDGKGALSVYVVRFRNAIYHKHLGPADALPDDKHVYPIGDLGQTITAVAVMQLFERDELDLERSIREYLPESPDSYQNINLEHLLNHTSGLPESADTFESEGEWPAPLFEAGTRDGFSRFGYALLRRVIADVSGRDYRTYVKESILDPVSMDDSYFDESGWHASLGDLYLWEESLNSNQLIRLKSLLRVFSTVKLEDGSRGAFGFGWRIEDHGGLRKEQANAGQAGHNACITRFSQKNYAIIVLSEIPTDELDAEKLSNQIAEIYLGREMPYLRHARKKGNVGGETTD